MKLEKLVGERFKERPADCVIDSHALMVKARLPTKYYESSDVSFHPPYFSYNPNVRNSLIFQGNLMSF